MSCILQEEYEMNKRIIMSHYELSEESGVGKFVLKVGSYLEKEGFDVIFVCSQYTNGLERKHQIIKVDHNIDLKHYISSHADYSLQIEKIVKRMNNPITFRHEFAPIESDVLATHMVYKSWLEIYSHNKKSFSPRFRKLAGEKSGQQYHCASELFQMKSKKIKVIFALSQRCKEDLIRLYDIPEELIVVVYNGVDLKDFDPPKDNEEKNCIRKRYNLSKQSIIVLFVGCNFARKGIIPLLNSFKIVCKKSQNVNLCIIGGGNRSFYERLAKKIGIEDRVKFKGIISNHDVQNYLKASDLFILSSFYDPCPLVIFEAMACGLPLIISTAIGQSEFMEDKKHCLKIVDVNNKEDLANAILRLAEDRQLRILFKKNNLRLSQQYTWQHTTKKISDTIKDKILV